MRRDSRVNTGSCLISQRESIMALELLKEEFKGNRALKIKGDW